MVSVDAFKSSLGAILAIPTKSNGMSSNESFLGPAPRARADSI